MYSIIADARLHRNPEQRQQAPTGGNTEVGAGNQQRQKAAEVQQHQEAPLERTEHGIQDQHDYQDGNWYHDRESVRYVCAGAQKTLAFVGSCGSRSLRTALDRKRGTTCHLLP
jgi:hypothetical protein